MDKNSSNDNKNSINRLTIDIGGGLIDIIYDNHPIFRNQSIVENPNKRPPPPPTIIKRTLDICFGMNIMMYSVLDVVTGNGLETIHEHPFLTTWQTTYRAGWYGFLGGFACSGGDWNLLLFNLIMLYSNMKLLRSSGLLEGVMKLLK